MARLLTDRAMAEAVAKMDLAKGDKGEPGGPGAPGKTPIKGKDYFTQQEIDDLVALIQSRVKDGDPGQPGRHGSTPARGIDYWSRTDQEAIIRDVLSRIPKLQPPVVDHAAIADAAVTKALSSKKLTIEHVDGLGKTLEGLTQFLKRGGFRGGGGNVLAGSNVTITANADGSQTISSSGGGSGFTALVATETPNGALTVFTFAAAAVQPSYIVSDNVWMKAVTKSGTVNWTWNGGLKRATLSVPPQDDIWGVT